MKYQTKSTEGKLETGKKFRSRSYVLLTQKFQGFYQQNQHLWTGNPFKAGVGINGFPTVRSVESEAPCSVITCKRWFILLAISQIAPHPTYRPLAWSTWSFNPIYDLHWRPGCHWLGEGARSVGPIDDGIGDNHLVAEWLNAWSVLIEGTRQQLRWCWYLGMSSVHR